MEEFRTSIKKFLPYLEDLRERFYSSTMIILGMFFVGFFSSGIIVKQFILRFDMTNVVLATTSPFQFANVAMDIGIFCALLIALPLSMYHFFSFAHSALTKQEMRKFLVAIPISFLLFVLGFSYGFFILFYSFEVLARVNESLGIQNIWDISLFMSQIFITSTLLGIIFQLPLVASLFIRMGILSVNLLKEQRRVVILLLFILVSLLPPTDGLSLIAMALPQYLLYEATILINLKSKHV